MSQKAGEVFIFDLDHTLFDTKRFKKELFSSLEPLGVPQSEVERSYGRIMNAKGKFIYDYSITRHLRDLRSSYEFSTTAARKQFAGVYGNTGKYLFPGAADMLKTLKTRGAKLILITRGNRYLNRKKIAGSGLKKYFSKIIASPESKLEPIRKITGSGQNDRKVWFINDNLEETTDIQERFPHISCVLKLRKDHSKRVKANFKKIREVQDLLRML